MIYLVGVDHRAQRKKREDDFTDCQREFQAVVESGVQSIQAGLVAEEDHPDFLSRDGKDSILLEIATVHGIGDRHQFIDANDAERERIGYRSQFGFGRDRVPAMAHEIMHHFPKREKFWLSKLQDTLHEDVLFVCGWGHIESFTALLMKAEVGYSVRADKIGADQCELEFYGEVRRYIKDNLAWLDNSKCFCSR